MIRTILVAAAVGLACIPLLPLGESSTQEAIVDSVVNGGLLFTDNRAGVSGVDAGFSIPMGAQTLWLFGDVFLLDPRDPGKPSRGALSNCGLLVPSGSGPAPLKNYRFLVDKEGLARELFSADSGADRRLRYWPFGGWHDQLRKRVYLYYGRVRTTGSGPLDFTTEGFGLASAESTSPSKIHFQRIPRGDGEELWWKSGGAPTFGSAVFHAGDTLYIVGHRRTAGKVEGMLARVRSNRINEFGEYEYFAGGNPVNWTSNAVDAIPIQGLGDFPSELSISFNRYLGRYLAVHSVGISERIRLSISKTPWGPYTAIAEIASPRRAFSRGFTYAGKEHPELSEGGGRIIYVTYVDSERYWLQMLKVTLRR